MYNIILKTMDCDLRGRIKGNKKALYHVLHECALWLIMCMLCSISQAVMHGSAH